MLELFMAVAPHAGGLMYAVGDGSGQIIHRGGFPDDAMQADVVVIADYALLGDERVLEAASSHRIGLIAPADGLDADAIAKLWAGTPPGKRAHLTTERLAELDLLVRARAEIGGGMQMVLESISGLLSAASEEYLALLSDEDALLPEILPFLREYPTPRLLRAAAVVRLAYALQTVLPDASNRRVDRILRFAEAAPGDSDASIESLLAESIIPGSIDMHGTLSAQLRALDRQIHLDAEQHSGVTAPMMPERGFSILETTASPSSIDMLGTDLETLRARVEELFLNRTAGTRRPLPDYQEFQRISSVLAPPDSPASFEDRLRLGTVGQLLALGTGDFLEAIRHRSSCEALLAACGESSERSPQVLRACADAALANALTETCAIDVVTGFSSLRAAVEGDAADHASPALLCEAAGLFALQLVFFGEHTIYPQALERMRRLAEACERRGPARAPADIAELFIASGRPELSEDALAPARAAAEESSSGTAYRHYYHYVVMVGCYVTKDFEQGIRSHAEITWEGVWPRFNSRFNDLTQLSLAILLAARGDFAGARRGLGRVGAAIGRYEGGSSSLIRGYAELRLDLAAGDHRSVLIATMPDGPLGEDRLHGAQRRRFLPTTLMLRGTALMGAGDRELAIDCFTRAIKHAVIADEWFTLLSAETPEFRAWLVSLDRHRLPGGLRPDVHDAVVARPVLIGRTLPQLTAQQVRVLRLLAQRRSVASIAAELHITENTMKSHLRRIYDRIGVRSRNQAVIRAEAYGLLAPL